MTGKIDPAKQYRTRDGREWRFLEFATEADPRSTFAIMGAYKNNDGNWRVNSWSEHGEFASVGPNGYDLIEVRPRIQRKVWINVYPDAIDAFTYPTREKADENAGPGRTECLEIALDYEEGEGL